MGLIRKTWNFIWHDDSMLSWVVNVILALVLVKFVIYPGLGFIFATTHPLVAVVSGSMEHNNLAFDQWWDERGQWYTDDGITKEEFLEFPLKNGFSRGDIMVLVGVNELSIGDVIVFRKDNGGSPPIIHRLVKNGEVLQSKGDNNLGIHEFEKNIRKDMIIGKAVLRAPYLGYVKIIFVDYLWNPIKSVLL